MKTKTSLLTIAIAAISIGVAVPVPEASAIPPTKRLGTNRNHVAEKQVDRMTLVDVIARRLAGTKGTKVCFVEPASKCVSTCNPVAERAAASDAKVKSAKPRSVRPYWMRKRHG